MKKTFKLILFLLCLASCNLILAKDLDSVLAMRKYYPEELCIGYGRVSVTHLLEGVVAGENGYNTYVSKSNSGIFSISYRHFVYSHFALGIACAYENETGQWQEPVDPYGGALIQLGTYKRNIFTIAPELLFAYTRERNEMSYGFISVAYSFQNEADQYSQQYYNSQYYNGVNRLGGTVKSNDRNAYSFQISPACFSIGHKIRGFAELGFGYKGIVCFGVLLKFGEVVW